MPKSMVFVTQKSSRLKLSTRPTPLLSGPSASLLDQRKQQEQNRLYSCLLRIISSAVSLSTSSAGSIRLAISSAAAVTLPVYSAL